MGYKISMALWKKGFVEKEYGICFAEPYIIYDSRGDSIEGGEDQPWATNQSLQLSKNQIGSFECDIPYELWHERYHLNRDDLVEPANVYSCGRGRINIICRISDREEPDF